jgi:hypothetical protein
MKNLQINLQRGVDFENQSDGARRRWTRRWKSGRVLQDQERFKKGRSEEGAEGRPKSRFRFR